MFSPVEKISLLALVCCCLASAVQAADDPPTPEAISQSLLQRYDEAREIRTDMTKQAPESAAATETTSSNPAESIGGGSSSSSSSGKKPVESEMVPSLAEGSSEKTMLENSRSNIQEGRGDCPICLEDLEKLSMTETECEHLFHKICLNRWRESGNTSCPVCRTSIPSLWHKECIICNDILPSDEHTKIECGHWFHTHCLEQWQLHYNCRDARTCPKCLDNDPRRNLNLRGWLFRQRRTWLDGPN